MPLPTQYGSLSLQPRARLVPIRGAAAQPESLIPELGLFLTQAWQRWALPVEGGKKLPLVCTFWMKMNCFTWNWSKTLEPGGTEGWAGATRWGQPCGGGGGARRGGVG